MENKILSTIDTYTGNPFGHPNEDHGTLVASFAAAETDGGSALASIGFNTMLRFYDCSSSNYFSLAEIAYHASFEDGVDVINCSLNNTYSTPTITPRERLLVKEILDNGTVIVRCAGNTQGSYDNDRLPFAHQVDSRIIIVSSTGSDDKHTCNCSGSVHSTHANYPEVDICAPGYCVIGRTRYDNGNNLHLYKRDNGSSYASPIVAGVCTLLKSINKNFTPAEIEHFIKTTADPIADAHLFPGIVGAGRVNAYKAVRAAMCIVKQNPLFDSITILNSKIEEKNTPFYSIIFHIPFYE